MKKLFLTLIIIPLLVSCRQSATLNQTEKEIIRKEVEQTLNDYYTDIRKSGLSAEFKYLDNSPDFFWVPPGSSIALSYDSVSTVIKQNAKNCKSVDNTFQSLRIIPLSKDQASYTARIRSTITDTSGKTMTFSLIETGILIKRQDGWKLLHGQTAIVE